MDTLAERLVRALVLALLLAWPAAADDAPQPFSREQLDQLTAPIALYPDTLLSQILMAATYPSDVADAAGWSKQHAAAKGDDAVRAVDSQPWDPAVKSLVAFPQVLAMMSDKPDWVQNLGDAFLASSKDVLDSVQRLRAKAKEAGHLESNEQQKVVVQQQPALPQVIVIEPADPEIVYVPSYNPTVVYGAWPYPAYPPYYYPPPAAYYPGAALASGIAFGVGVGITAALWSDCDWRHGDVDIDVDRHNDININNRLEANQSRFQHNSNNRRGVPYRDSRSQQQYGRNIPGAAERAGYRGRDPARAAQRQQAQSALSERGMDPGRARDEIRNDPQARERAQNAVRDVDRDRVGLERGRDGAGGFDRNRAGAADNSRIGGGFERDAGARARAGSDNAFRNAGNAGQMRQQIDRGSASRQQMSQRRGGGGGRRR